ncbi:Gfo/Idh/MocA family protein [Nocardiopsis sp. CC223A]|uniref:Gfo/Idh/MocA family protein n=1 Tax=Nocardiopsis sp. CC223A TaxID=3044051 RepID=UPI00278C126A|nr:Gfo/Idh/MocA family oxidoreductase [Nocardiopsis sp. CC223A]
MGSTPVRFGVMGCGSIAQRRTLPAMMLHPSAEISSVASRDAAKAEELTRRFGGTAVEGYAALLHRPDVDAVYVTTPTGLHAEWAAHCIRAGKHVLVEKPLASEPADVRDLVELARRHDVVLMENLMFRHHSQHQEVAKLLSRGDIGELRSLSAAFGIPPRSPDDVRLSRELGGGALLDLGVYLLETASMYLGEEIRVRGAVLREDRDSDVDVAGHVLLSAGEATAELTFGFGFGYRCAYSLWGSEGRLTLDRAYTAPPEWRPRLEVARQDHFQELTLASDDQFLRALEHFVAAVQGTESTEENLRSALRNADLTRDIRDMANFGAGIREKSPDHVHSPEEQNP